MDLAELAFKIDLSLCNAKPTRLTNEISPK